MFIQAIPVAILTQVVVAQAYVALLPLFPGAGEIAFKFDPVDRDVLLL